MLTTDIDRALEEPGLYEVVWHEPFETDFGVGDVRMSISVTTAIKFGVSKARSVGIALGARAALVEFLIVYWASVERVK